MVAPEVVIWRLVLEQVIAATAAASPSAARCFIPFGTYFFKQAESFSNFSILTSDSETRANLGSSISWTKVLQKYF